MLVSEAGRMQVIEIFFCEEKPSQKKSARRIRIDVFKVTQHENFCAVLDLSTHLMQFCKDIHVPRRMNCIKKCSGPLLK